MTPEKAFEMLTDNGFKVEDKRPEREYFVITCKECGARYSLEFPNGKVKEGNMLVLLDHIAGHLVKEKKNGNS